MIILKEDIIGYCKTGCVRPPVWDAIIIASNIFAEYSKDLVITSLCDGKHSKNSKHYEGNAIDLRRRHLTSDELTNIYNKLANTLGDDYDVIIETTHIHIEYDPKEVN